jgi:hypothetical protein
MTVTKITQEMIDQNVLWYSTRFDDAPQGERLVICDANLSGANLRYANLRYADLRYANLRYADLRYADLSNANISNANLSNADLSNANLSGANLRYANLSNANLSGANLSGATGLLSASTYIADNFEKNANGIIGYKCFDQHYTPNDTWVLSSGSIIEEVVNFSRQSDCGCGVNVGTKEYVNLHTNKPTVWRVLIRWEWMVGVCVPYATDGKIRCEKVELLEEMTRAEFLAICE